MAIRFKFRSSVNFDSVDIDARSSISVRDLKFKIVEQKKLKICEDVDLVISDADTGKEYEDENCLIASGSSVIIKRVPAGRLEPSILPHINSVENLGPKKANFIDTSQPPPPPPSVNLDMDSFDDFGIELYPGPAAGLSDSDVDAGSENADNVVPRCSEPSIVRGHIEPSDISESIPRGAGHCAIEGNASQTKLKARTEEHKKFEDAVNACSPAMPITDLPSELRCSLCNTIFKEAVMIPCCQHSFCGKCIRLVLVEKARCPKCFSTKCKVEDLLPNVSLRQAIEHFLESQMLISGSDNVLPKYAPDGESGIQAKDVSCAVSILQREREPVLPHSPSATGKGSNLVMAESASPSWQKIRHMNGERNAAARIANFKSAHEGLKLGADFQGESQPLKLPQTLMRKEEADFTIKKKKGLWVNTSDGIGSFMATNRHRKGDRTCYMCGSPDHFVRDCPAASSPYPMLQSGGMSAFRPPYWHPSSLSHVRPFANVYGTPGMMPFDPTMVSVTPFAIPSYMPSMYAGVPVPCGVMRMGGLAPPMMTGAERPLHRAEFMEFQASEQGHKHLKEHHQREPLHDDDDSDACYHYNEPERRLHNYKPQLDRENNGSYYEDIGAQRSRKKHPCDKCPDEDIDLIDWRHDKTSRSSVTGRDHRPYHSERSISEIQDMSDSSNRHCKERQKHHRSSKKHSERRGQCGSESSRSHHRSHKEMDTGRKRDEPETKRCSRKHQSHSGSCLEPSSSGDRKRQRKEKEPTHSSRHSKHKVKSTDDRLSHDRWEMVDGLDEDYKGDYRPHKRKRVH